MLFNKSVLLKNALAQNVDYQYSCQGRISQDQRIIILNLNSRLGGFTVDGDLNGDAIVGGVFGDSDGSIKIVAGRKSEMIGSALAPIHKVMIYINKTTGTFNLEVL